MEDVLSLIKTQKTNMEYNPKAILCSVALKINRSKLDNESLLSTQIERVVKRYQEKWNIVFKSIELHFGTANDDIIKNKITLLITYCF